MTPIDPVLSDVAVEYFGATAVFLMVLFYALEKRHHAYVALFALACGFAATYAFLIESYPFMLAEGIWSLVAIKRWTLRFRARQV